MADFKFRKTTKGTETQVVLSGTIEEGVQFPPLEDLPRGQKVIFDLKDVESINSLGIRDWVTWINPLGEKFNIVLRNCPKKLIPQFNMVHGFLPTGSTVESLFVPFYCEKCDLEENFLFQVDSQIKITDGSISLDVDIEKIKPCKNNPCELKLDVSPDKYFQFLKRV